MTGDVRSLERRHLLPGLQQIASRSGLVIERGHGALLYDDTGREYIDLWAGGGVCSIGHAHPRQVEAISAQARAFTVGSFSSAVRSKYLSRLAAVTPGELNRVQLYTGGAEAVEAAMRFARSRTGREGVLSFTGAFHGKTTGALALAGGPLRSQYGPADPRVAIAPYPPAGPVGDCDVHSAIDGASELIERDLSGRPAAIILEPVQGTAANVQPADGFLAAAHKLANATGALLIFDEIITGFGRTGSMFAAELASVVPDAVVIGKGMGNGMPISGLVVRDELSDAAPFTGPSGSSSSYGGNPISCAAALVTLEVIEDERLVDNARDVGERMRSALRTALADIPQVASVRGIGLLIGVDLVEASGTAPLAREHCARLFELTLSEGLVVPAYSPLVRINPPLCIDDQQVDRAVAGMARALTRLTDELS